MTKLSERLEALAEARNATYARCPADKPKGLGNKECPICRAGPSEACGVKSVSDYQLATFTEVNLPTIIEALKAKDL